MARKRSFLGKNPGGKFRGIPGNPTNMLGWGGVFKKKGDWGILNPMEWTGFTSKTSFTKTGPRPQGQLQKVIEYNLGFGKQIGQAQGVPSRPQRPEVQQRQTPITGGQGIVEMGPRIPQGNRTGGGGAVGNTGGGKPAPISAAVKAMKNPAKRGR